MRGAGEAEARERWCDVQARRGARERRDAGGAGGAAACTCSRAREEAGSRSLIVSARTSKLKRNCKRGRRGGTATGGMAAGGMVAGRGLARQALGRSLD